MASLAMATWILVTMVMIRTMKQFCYNFSDIWWQHGPEHGAEALPQQPGVGEICPGAAADLAQEDRYEGGGHRVSPQGRLRSRLLQGQLRVSLW